MSGSSEQELREESEEVRSDVGETGEALVHKAETLSQPRRAVCTIPPWQPLQVTSKLWN